MDRGLGESLAYYALLMGQWDSMGRRGSHGLAGSSRRTGLVQDFEHGQPGLRSDCLTAPGPGHGALTGPGSRSIIADVTRGGLWGVGGQAGRFFATFLATSFTVRLLGPARYGLWSLLLAVLNYASISDMGMSSASTRFAADRHVLADDTGEARVIWTALAITVCSATSIALCVAVVAPFIVRSVLHVPVRLEAEGVLGLRLTCAAFVALAVAATANTPQLVRLRWRGYTIVTSGSTIVQVLAVPASLAVIAGGVATAAAVALGAALLSVAGNVVLGLRLQPRLRKPVLDRHLVLPLLRYGGGLTLAGLAAIPLMNAERFFLARFDSTVAVAHYAIASSLAGSLAFLPFAASAPLFPAFVRLQSQGANPTLRHLYATALQGAVLVVTPIALVLAFMARPFLEIWAGPSYAQSSIIPFYILVVGLWSQSLAYVPYTYLLASGKTSLIAKIYLAALAPYIAFAAGLTAAFGIVGAASASASLLFVQSGLYFAFTHRTSGLPLIPVPRHARMYMIGMVLMAALLYVIHGVLPSLAERVPAGVIVLGLYSWIVWRFLLPSDDRARARGLMTRLRSGI